MLFDVVSVSISLFSCTRGFAPHQHPRNQKTAMIIALAT